MLDDNKKLCLNSGEIIQMSASMNMIFEVQDLAVASPATVSRCGMVYVEPSSMGWRPLFDSWLHTLPEALEPFKQRIADAFEWLVNPCIHFVRRYCGEMVPTADINLPRSFMSNVDCHLGDFQLGKDGSKPKVNAKEVPKILDGILVFSLIWSIGGSTDNEGRARFSDFLRKLLKHEVDKSADRTDYDLGPGLELQIPEWKLSTMPPDTGLVYDYVFDLKKAQWRHWLDTVTIQPPAESSDFNSLVIQTIDTGGPLEPCQRAQSIEAAD